MAPVRQDDDVEGLYKTGTAQDGEFLFFPLPPSEAGKRVPIFDRGTRTKLEGSDPAAWSRA